MKRLGLAIALALVALATGCAREKSTGPCQLIYQIDSKRYWFMRPNQEIFEMYFDNPPVILSMIRGIDTSVSITYTDDNKDMRHFIKAQVITTK